MKLSVVWRSYDFHDFAYISSPNEPSKPYSQTSQGKLFTTKLHLYWMISFKSNQSFKKVAPETSCIVQMPCEKKEFNETYYEILINLGN